MNGAHDLGGKQGLGPVNPEPEDQEPRFHAEWERRVFALTMAAGMLGKWNIDESRHARERQHPLDYLGHSYYENWMAGVEKLLVEKGLINHAELSGDKSESTAGTTGDLRVPDAAAAEKILRTGGPTLLESSTKPKFNIDDRVLVKKQYTAGHTRSPGYAQGSIGVIVESHGCHVYPDKNAQGERVGEHLYSVSFTSASLWGSESDNSEVLIDLWEPYLELVK